MKKTTVTITMTEKSKKDIKTFAKSKGLSLSAYLELAGNNFMNNQFFD